MVGSGVACMGYWVVGGGQDSHHRELLEGCQDGHGMIRSPCWKNLVVFQEDLPVGKLIVTDAAESPHARSSVHQGVEVSGPFPVARFPAQ